MPGYKDNSTEPISVLNPVFTLGCIVGKGTAGNILEGEVGAVHDVKGRELQMFHVEVIGRGIGDVLEHKWLTLTASYKNNKN
jgi:hypothetical protein